MTRRRPNYTAEEIKGLVEEYEALRASADTTRRGIRHIVILADLTRALEQLPDKYWEVVLLHGLLGVPQRETAEFLQIKQPTVAKRYRVALEEMFYILNGGGDD